MTVGIFSFPLLRFFDASGLPLAGAKVSSYLAGTSTPAALYADAAGTQPLTNPAVADSSGSLLAYMPVGIAYKVNVTDQNGVQQAGFPIDNITIAAAIADARLLPTGVTITTAQVTLTAVNGQATPLIAAGFHDAKKMILSVTANVTATFSAANNLVSLAIGDPGQTDRWGSGIARASGTQPGLRFGGLPVFATATDLWVSPEGGTFGSTGTIVLTKTVLTFP